MIQINEEHAKWQYRFNNNILNVSSNNKFEQITWNNEIGEILQTHEMVMTDHKSIIEKVTKNKTIMDYAIQYIKDTNQLHKLIPIINHA